ncbi:MAG: carboxypeptidase-like regulatory domain-containing protein [Nitrososphaera sp.]
MTTGAFEIRGQFAELQRRYKEFLPKVDPELIDELLLRQMENPSNPEPIFMLEVFTKAGLDTEMVRRYIIEKTGMSPAIYDNGTHYVTNQKLSLEILKEISDSDDVLEVTGEYTGGIGAYGASHEHRERENTRGAAGGRESPPEEGPGYIQGNKKNGNLRIAAYTAAGIIGAVVVAGVVISGGILPNANVSGSNGRVQIPGVPGVLHGYVGGPEGLPAIGASVIAAEQNTGYNANAFVSVNGQYFIDLPPGNYIIIAAYPDGSNRVVRGFDVTDGSEHRLDFAY